MSDPQLTTGAIYKILRGVVLEDPILQIIGSKRIDSQSAEKSRHRILLSDGKYKVSYAMYTVQPNDKLAIGGEIAENTVIKMKKFITSTIAAPNKGGEKNVLIILDVEVVKDGKQVGRILGSPEALPSDLSTIENKENNSSSNSASSLQSNSRTPTSNDYEPAPKRPNLSGPAPSADTSSFSAELIMPISSLSPYQNKWVIKARVTNKGPIRKWSNSKGEGQLFSFDLLDQSGEIRATGFRDMVDKYYEFLQVDKIYYISKCQIKMANKKFSSLKNDYEMTLGAESVIQECAEDGDMPTVQYSFTTFDKIAAMEANTMIDVIGVCKQIGDVQTLTARSTGKELKKRDIVLVDQSKSAITLTLWGNDAEAFDSSNDIVAVKGARITEFGGGKSISVPNGGTFKLNPDVKEAFALRGWYDNGGNREEAANLSARTGGGGGAASWFSFKQVQNEGLGATERGDYYQNVATILMIRSENLMYEACANEGCNKKVVNLENGRYRCEKCNIESTEFKYRLIGNMNLGDWSGNQWSTIFNPDCEFIFGKTAQEIGDGARNDPSFMQNLASDANFKQFQFKFRVKTETYNDDSRLQTVAVKVEPVNYRTYNAQLLSQIQAMTA